MLVGGAAAAGLARGGSMDNAVVLDEEGVVNPEGLRFADEFVRHKALDALGDLYLAGAPILGRYSASRPGHAINNEALRALLRRVGEEALPGATTAHLQKSVNA